MANLVPEHFRTMKSKTCTESVIVFLRFFQITGQFALSFHNRKLVKSKLVGHLPCYFWILMILTRVMYLIHHNVKKSDDIVTLSNICLIIEACFTIFVNLSSLKQEHHIQFFNKLEEYDEKVRSFDSKKQDDLRALWITIAFVACCFLTRLVIDLLQFRQEQSKLSWHECLELVPSTIFLFFLSCNTLKLNLQLLLLRQRFAHFNKTLSKYNISGTSNGRQCEYDVKELRTLLCDGCEFFNDIYSLPFFSVASLTVMSALSSVYMENVEHLYGSSVWIMLLLLLSICTSCHLTAIEANETGKIVMAGKITLIYACDIEDRINVGIHLLHHRVCFSAAGCFDMNLQFYGNVMTLLVACYWLSDYPVW